MKKIYLSLSMVMLAGLSMAQNVSTIELSTSTAREITPVVGNSAAIDATDTLGLEEFGTQIFQYGSPTGYVFGTNDLYDAQFDAHQYNYEYAAGYISNDPYNVIGAMMWFGGKADVSGSPADLKVKMYSLADNKALSSATVQTPDVIGPDQMRGSVNLPFADCDTASTNIPTYAFFSTPIWHDGDFALAVDIKDLYAADPAAADTVWLYASEDGASDGTMTWTKLGFDISPQTFWARTTGMLQNGLDVNLALFAIVAESGVGIEEQGYLNGVKMTTFPNPALAADNVTIQYGIETGAEKVEINIFDMNGKVVFTAAEGAKTNGLYNVNVPVGTLNAGSYIYSIQADNARVAKRMEILK